MRLSALIAFALFGINLNCLAMDTPVKIGPRIITQTPCPFFNVVLAFMEKMGTIGADTTTVPVKALVDFSEEYFGINRNLMNALAKGRADDKGEINIAELLNPAQFPAHRGSLARVDANTAEQFAQVDKARLNVLVNDPQFSVVLDNTKYISYKQLKAYQTEFCWANSDMDCIKDWAPAKAEAHLLWALFGAYRVKYSNGTELIPLALVDNFLRNSTLPEHFRKNAVDPASLCSVGWAVLTE